MKSTSLPKLREEIRRGVFDTAALREAWDEIFQQADHNYMQIGEMIGCPVVFCDCCGKPCFAQKTKSAYQGARWVCEDACLPKYGYCDPCRTYVLLEEFNNPTHVHEGRENPGFLYFPQDQQMAAYNADVMQNGAKFYKTPSEIKMLASRKTRSRDPERVFRNFGVELEVEKLPGGPPDILQRTRKALGDFVMVKRDGSLSRHGQGGFEIVSAPATLAFHKEGAWSQFFKFLGPFFQEQPLTTGLHIHVGLNTLSPLTVNKLILFVNAPENREFVFGLANRNLLRKNPNGRIYAGVKEWSLGDMMRLKQHGGACPWNPTNAGKKSYYVMQGGNAVLDPYGNPVIASLDGAPSIIRAICRCPEGHYNIEHYEAVNLRTHRPTVELRMFRGIVSEVFLYACLEFVDSLCDFLAESSVLKVHFKNYLDSLEGKYSRYPNLYRLLVNQLWIDPPKDKKRMEHKVPVFGIYA